MRSVADQCCLPARCCLLLGLASFAPRHSWWVLVLAQFVIGLGTGVLESCTNALANDIARPGGHAGEQNLLHAFYGLGAILGPLLIGASLASGHGWRPAFAAGAAGAAVLVVLLTRIRVPQRPEGAVVVSARSLLALASNPLVLVLGLIIGLYVGEEMTIGNWAATYLQRVQGLRGDLAAGCVGLYWGALAGGRLLAALASRVLTALQILIGSATLALASTMLLLCAPSAPVALVALVLCGLGFAATYPTTMALAGVWFPQATGSVAALLVTASSVMSSLVPMVSGVLVQAFNARIGLATCPVCAAAILCLAARLERRSPARSATSGPDP